VNPGLLLHLLSLAQLPIASPIQQPLCLFSTSQTYHLLFFWKELLGYLEVLMQTLLLCLLHKAKFARVLNNSIVLTLRAWITCLENTLKSYKKPWSSRHSQAKWIHKTNQTENLKPFIQFQV
jgi:hypothetical protein